MSKGQIDEDGGDYGSFRDDIAPAMAPMRDEVPRYQTAPPMQPALQAAPPLAPVAPAPVTAAPQPQRPSILRRPISAEPLGPNNPAPLPSRYR